MREAIDRLGGRAELTERLDLSRSAVYMWIRAGRFPYQRRPELEALARERLILLPDHLFEVGAKRGRKRKDAETQKDRTRDRGAGERSLAAG